MNNPYKVVLVGGKRLDFLEISEMGEKESLLRKETHRFAEEVMRPAADELDKMTPEETAADDSPYWDIIEQMKDMGYHKIWVPQEEGGEGLTPKEIHIVYEELGWGSAGLTTGIGVDCIPPSVISLVGAREAKDKFLKPWMEDEDAKFHGCWAVTEPEHGSDWLLAPSVPQPEKFGEAEVTAEKDGDEWVISGSKAGWVSSAPCATHALTHVGFPEEDCSMSAAGLALIPLDRDGVTKSKPVDMLGMRDDPQGDLAFDNVRIPEINLIVQAPNFYKLFAQQLICFTSSFMGAIFTGVARAAFEEAYQYASERSQGGKPLIEHDSVKRKLYELFQKIQVSRHHTRQVIEHAWKRIIQESAYDASVVHGLSAQIVGTNTAYEVAHEALQIFGGYGLSKDYLIEKLYRDARCGLIMDGVNELLSLSGGYELNNSYKL